MKTKYIIWTINAIACLTIGSPAWAQLLPTAGKLKSTQPLAESVISQTPTEASVKITNVSIVSTPTGINVLLTPESGTLPPAITSKSGNTLVTDIPNTTLALGNDKVFQSANPATGIASVVVTQFTPTSVRVAITGTENIPDVAVVPSGTGLTLSATPLIESEIEITVTAQKRRERLKDVPISVKVIPRQQIEDARIQTFRDVANNTPNFTFRPAGGGRQFAFYSFRGLSNSNFLSRKDTLGFYIDEVPYDNGAFIDLDLLDLDRIEILRGPQSTLYGRNSQAGVINITTRQPSNDPELRASASYGSYNERDLKVSASTPLIKDNLLVSVGGGYRANDGFYRNTVLNKSEGQQSSLAGRLQFLWKPQPELTVALNTNVSSQDDGDTFYTSKANPFQTQTNESGFVRNQTNTQALKVAYDHPDYRLTSVTTRRFSDQNGRNVLGVAGLDLLSNYGFDNTLWSQEFRVQSPPNNKNQLAWTAGLYTESTDSKNKEASVYSPALASVFGLPASGADLVRGNIGSKTYAAFGQVDYKPIDPLTVTAGLRYETNDLRLSSRQRSFTPTGATTPASVSGVFDNVTAKDSELLPRLALQYRFSPDVSAYASLTRGYKPGSYNYRADTVDIQRIQPERSWNYEVGVKTAFLNNKVTANLSAFSHQIDNYQLALQGSDGFFRTITSAGVGITGLELEVNANPLDGLNLIAGVGVTNAKFTRYINPLTNANLTGNQLPFASNLTYNLAAQYRHSTGLLGRLELTGVGKTFFDEANQITQDPYGTVNARIGYEANDYGVYLFANNLFDTRYTTGGFAFPAPNIIYGFGAPATYGIQVKASF